MGLGTWILAVETVPGTDPLAEQSTLVFALSPLTGRICDALSSFTLCKFLR
jgi:aldehyde:ferredoxin oxidoreductase